MENTATSPAEDLATKAMELCLSCGLCCHGVLHSHAGLDPDEVEFALSMQLPVVQKGYEYDAFSLPCPRFDEKQYKCSIFPDRPRVCGAYACDLLKQLREGALEFDECMETVRQTQALIESIYRYLGGRDDSVQLWDQVRRFAVKQTEEHGLTAFHHDHAKLLLDVKRLALLCGRYEAKSFEPWTHREVMSS